MVYMAYTECITTHKGYFMKSSLEENKSEWSYSTGLKIAGWSGIFVSSLMKLQRTSSPDEFKNQLNQVLKAYSKIYQLTYPGKVIESNGQLTSTIEGLEDAMTIYQGLQAIKQIADTWHGTSDVNFIEGCKSQLASFCSQNGLPIKMQEDKSEEIGEFDESLGELLGQEAILSDRGYSSGLLQKGATALKLIQSLPKIVNALGPMKNMVEQVCKKTKLVNSEFQLWWAIPSASWGKESYDTRKHLYDCFLAVIVNTEDSGEKTLQFKNQLNDLIMSGVDKLLRLSTDSVTASADIGFNQVISCFSLSANFINPIFSLIRIKNKDIISKSAEQAIKESISFALGEAIAPILLKHIATEVLNQQATEIASQIKLRIKKELVSAETQKKLCETVVRHLGNFSFNQDELRAIARENQSASRQVESSTYWPDLIETAKILFTIGAELLGKEVTPVPIPPSSTNLNTGITFLSDALDATKSAVVNTVMQTTGLSMKLKRQQANIVDMLAKWTEIAVSNSAAPPPILDEKRNVVMVPIEYAAVVQEMSLHVATPVEDKYLSPSTISSSEVNQPLLSLNSVIELVPDLKSAPDSVAKPEPASEPESVAEHEFAPEPELKHESVKEKFTASSVSKRDPDREQGVELIPLLNQDGKADNQPYVLMINQNKEDALDIFEIFYGKRPLDVVIYKKGGFRLHWEDNLKTFVPATLFVTMSDDVNVTHQNLSTEYKTYKKHLIDSDKYNDSRGLHYFSKPIWLSSSKEKATNVDLLLAELNDASRKNAKNIIEFKKVYNDRNSANVLIKNRDSVGLALVKGTAILVTGVVPYLIYCIGSYLAGKSEVEGKNVIKKTENILKLRP